MFLQFRPELIERLSCRFWIGAIGFAGWKVDVVIGANRRKG